MKLVRSLYHFLGGIRFALILIGATALFVILGTFIESVTQSHLYAALFTYHNPLFALLLWGFFINIFLSSTRRWPFKKRHIPFLITHFGLLMILGGVLAKHYFGMQGTMHLAEGTASDEILLPNTHAIHVESRDSPRPKRYPLQKDFWGRFQGIIAENDNALSIRLAEFYPHCTEHLASWVKGSHAFIGGHKPIPLHRFTGDENVLFPGGQMESFDLYALKASVPQKAISKLYSQNDIIQKLFFAVIQDDEEDVYLAAGDSHGRIWSQPFPKANLDVLIAYDDGFAGYTTKATLPFPNSLERDQMEKALLDQFTLKLKQAQVEGKPLAPPLEMMVEASKKAGMDFSESASQFFSHWNDSRQWIYPENLPLPDSLKDLFAALDWTEMPPSIKQGCEWVVHLFDQLKPDLIHNRDLLAVLKKNGWPLFELLEKEAALDLDPITPYTLLTHQLFAASELRPPEHSGTEIVYSSPEHQAVLLSALLRAYGIHLKTVTLPVTITENFSIETLVLPKQQLALPTKKLEENKPKAILFLDKGQRKQAISLAYDPTGRGMKWPVLDGEYLVRFQPLFEEIPYQVRLRQARQINYANSSQPYSFEGDLIFKDKRDQDVMEKTISMNKVHETWDGYRFYLSTIAPSDESTVKHVQIVVNYDPAKYLLTYPGAFILSLGILLLFWLRPYKL